MSHPRRIRAVSTVRAALALSLLSLVPGCAQPLSPSDVAGRYALERVGNDPLPVYWTGPADEPQRLLESSVVLSADGTAQTVMRIEELWGATAPRLIVHRTDWVYEVDGLLVHLKSPPCTADICSGVVGQMEFRLLGDALVANGGLIFHRSDAEAP